MSVNIGSNDRRSPCQIFGQQVLFRYSTYHSPPPFSQSSKFNLYLQGYGLYSCFFCLTDHCIRRRLYFESRYSLTSCQSASGDVSNSLVLYTLAEQSYQQSLISVRLVCDNTLLYSYLFYNGECSDRSCLHRLNSQFY